MRGLSSFIITSHVITSYIITSYIITSLHLTSLHHVITSYIITSCIITSLLFLYMHYTCSCISYGYDVRDTSSASVVFNTLRVIRVLRPLRAIRVRGLYVSATPTSFLVCVYLLLSSLCSLHLSPLPPIYCCCCCCCCCHCCCCCCCSHPSLISIPFLTPPAGDCWTHLLHQGHGQHLLLRCCDRYHLWCNWSPVLQSE